MSKPGLKDFLDNRQILALKLSFHDAPVAFQKKFTIPLNTASLALFPDGTAAKPADVKDIASQFDLLLVKEGDILLRFAVDNLRSLDNFGFSASFDLHVRIQTWRDDLLTDFVRSFFNFPGHYMVQDLKTALGPEIRRLLTDFVSETPAADLHRRNRTPDALSRFRPELERFFFGTGVDVARFGDVAFESADYAARAAAEARRDEEIRRRNEKQERKEERIRRLAAFMQDQSMKDLLEKMPDERAKGFLYAKLMEDDSLELNPRELAARLSNGSDGLAELIYKTMEGLLSGGPIEGRDLPLETSVRIYCALGSKVLEIDPQKPGDTPREFNFKDPLRSVRVAVVDGHPVLLAGCKRTVHLVTLEGDLDCLEYPLPGEDRPRGGVNAIAAAGEYLFATHSEYGLIRWNRHQPGAPGERLYESHTASHRTTRAATVAGDRLFFASGPVLYASSAQDGAPPTAYESGLESGVTTLAIGGGMIYAGTEGGGIVAWKLDQPDRPAVLVRRREPIANLRLARICSIPHLLYSAKDLSVRARVIGQTLETSYESGGAGVGVLEAASDVVCATDGVGRRLFLWKAATPARPFAEVDLSRHSDKPVLDVGMRKATEAVETAAAV